MQGADLDVRAREQHAVELVQRRRAREVDDERAGAKRRRKGGGGAEETALKVLLDSARETSYRLWATNSPFESKDALRKRGYWWDAPARCWSRELWSRDEVQAEIAWLKQTVFGGRGVALDLDEFDARTRYSTRPGKREKVRA